MRTWALTHMGLNASWIATFPYFFGAYSLNQLLLRGSAGLLNHAMPSRCTTVKASSNRASHAACACTIATTVYMKPEPEGRRQLEEVRSRQ